MNLKSPLKNGLFVRRYFSNKILIFLNLLCFLKHKKSIPKIPKKPKKILLCNIANLGDVVISTTVLPVIKKHFPSCEIGFLASSNAGKIVLKHHPLISKIHSLDHWALTKQNTPSSRYQAALQYLIKTRKLRKEIEKCNYEIAIDLYSYFPNTIPFLYKCKIPIRIGYPTGGFSYLLTHAASWNFAHQYIGYAHLHLLEKLKISTQTESPFPAYNFKNKQSEYVVIHTGSSEALRHWDIQNWILLIQRLNKLNWEIILTGNGVQESIICDQISAHTSVKNLCSQLNWLTFVTTIQEARLLITVESVPIHIAAGSQTPTVVIFSGIASSSMWCPSTSWLKVSRSPVSCSPCFQRKGCSAMKCLQEISVDQVYQQVVNFYENRK